METKVQINTLLELINKLNTTNGKVQDISDLLENAKLDSADFSKYQHWNQDHYTRNCIIRTEKFELLLICWNAFQSTQIHDHNNSDGWVYCVDGAMTEERFEPTPGKYKKTSEGTLKKGQMCYINDNIGYHRLRNPLAMRTMTMHLYMKPIKKCELYTDDMYAHKTAYMTYYSIDGELV